MPEGKSQMPQWEMDEEIVISGISGRFPEADSIDELGENLYNHVDMITADDRRWPIGLYGLPSRSGKLKDLSKFDAQFFGVHGKQADLMDPQARILLELTYEAIVDAGINPQTLRGTRTGVYIGACVSEVEEGLVSDISKVSGYALTGCSRSMFSNRISYTFDFQGPSYSIDTACSSSFLAFQQAILGMRTNQCDQAIVGGVNICVRPATSLQFNHLSMLASDGSCKHMDAEANGYVRSETCSVVLLQKKSAANRIYATVIHAKTNTDGHKEEGVTFPSSDSQLRLMKETVEEAGIDPNDVQYVEAHGTGTPAGDPVETRAIARVYCQNRQGPLLIGSVKSNLGHSEPASGLNSISKVLLSFQNKLIPANLHYKNPSPKIPELINGAVKPVSENTPFNGGLVAINSFGFGGVNVHVILKPHLKELEEKSRIIVENIPRIIPVAGRTEDAVNHILDFIETNPDKVNKDFLALLNNVNASDNSGLNYRGYLLVDKQPDGQVSFPREVTRVSEKRPVWFVYSGMGSQWTSMVKGLMCVDTFRNSINKSAEILKPYNIDLLNLVLSSDENALNTTVAPFVCIASVQIALTDILRQLGTEPDGIVGHSVGELGCAYADGAFDHKQMLLAAYWRGKCVEEAHLPKGMMAAVGLSWEEAQARCPKGVVAACHNSVDSVTISGSYEETSKFVKQLVSENIFAREVNSGNVAFHSFYMQAIAPALLEKLRQIIPKPILRTSRWLSSSYPESSWNEESAKYSNPEYFVNNLTSPVLFDEATKHIPKNAIVIEIAPHCLLQSIIKRSLGTDIAYITLMKRNNNEGNLNMLFSAIGKLFNVGLNPKISSFYPKVEFPVSRSVQNLSSLIRWDHSQSWLVTLYPEYFNPSSTSDFSVKVDLQEANDEFYAGHCIDGRVLFPATGYLFLAWQMLAKLKGQFYDKLPVEFEDVTLHRATILSSDIPVKFEVRMMEVNGEFTISEGGGVIVTGKISVPEKSPLRLQQILTDGSVKSDNSIVLQPKDIYKELRVRGYDYGKTFQGIVEANADSKMGKLKFSNWIVLADTMLQIGILNKSGRGLYLPVRFQSIRCDPTILFDAVKHSEENVLNVVNDPRINAMVVPGLEIQGLKINLAPRRQNAQTPVLQKYIFSPYSGNSLLNVNIQHQLKDYIDVTSALAFKLTQLFPSSSLKNIIRAPVTMPESILNQYLDSNNDDYLLIKIFKDLLENSTGNLKSVLSQYTDWSNDLLYKIYESQYLMRQMIDVVIENHTFSQINITEVNATSRILCDTVKEFVSSSTYSLKLNYTLLNSTNTEIDEVKVIPWIPTSKLSLDSNCTDLLIFKDSNVFSTDPNNSVNYSEFLDTASQSIKDNGFFMAIFRSNVTVAENVLHAINETKVQTINIKDFVNKAQTKSFELICNQSDSLTTTVLLFRKVESYCDPSKQTVIKITNTDYSKWVDPLIDALAEHQTKPAGENIWLIANDHPANGLLGLVKCLRQEPGGDKVRCILNTPLHGQDSLPPFNFSNKTYSEILKKDLAINIYRNNTIGSFRHYDIDEENFIDTEHAYLNVETRGDLSSLRWYESPNKYWPIIPKNLKNPNESLCTVYYTPLNFRDIMLATGKLPPDALPGDLALQDCILGLEFSGRDQSGKRVMGMIPAKGLATTVLIDDPEFIWPIPDNWSMEEASTVPVVYGTAFYALVIRGEIESGESILIHSGSGGVGQAAISIALSLGCTVYTTVGSEEKKEYLKRIFPALTDANFANSRDTSFEQHILRQTNGRGVDVVLNSLSEEKLQASVRCLAQHGRFLEIGKYDLSENNPLGMAAFLKNIAFHGILLDALFGTSVNSSAIISAHKKRVAQLIRDGIKSGAVRPLKSTVFDFGHSEEAFRFMASGKHIGKVVLKIRNEEIQKVTIPKAMLVKAIPRTILNPLKTYIVTGGLGGFGLELTKWLVERGANNVVLTSRSGPREPYQHLCIKRIKEIGVKCLISTADVSTIEGTTQLIKEASSLGPVGGIFNLAMVLSDKFMKNQTVESFDKVCKAKVIGTQNLDAVTRKLIPDLEYFVSFSSISCGFGNAGQTNYGFANSSMERVCERRRAEGIHGLAVQWGGIGDVGVVAEFMGNDTEIGGTVPQRMPSCLSTLDKFLHSGHSVCTSLVRAKRQVESSGNKQDLIKSIAHILGIKDYKNLAPSNSLSELGMDSLMGVEVKQTLERDYDVILSMQELRSLTIGKLEEIGGQSGDKSAQGESAPSKLELSMPSISLPTDSFVRLNSVEEGKPIFFLPPLEGTFDLLEVIAKNIKRPVIGLNWTLDLTDFTCTEEASYYLIQQAKKHSNSDSYDLVGYSFGTMLAFDMAIQLQQAKCKVNLSFLDASPTHLSVSTEQYRQMSQAIDEDQKFVEALVTFLIQLIPINYTQLKSELSSLKGKESRLKRASEILIQHGGPETSLEDIATAADTFIKKVMMMLHYRVSRKFNGDILLLKAQENIINSEIDSLEDYGVSEIVTGKSILHILNGNHKSFILKNVDQISSLINEAHK